MTPPKNRESFLYRRDAEHFVQYLVPEYATQTSIHRDDAGWWINVWWNCGIIAPLTIQEAHQANPEGAQDYAENARIS